MPVPSRTNHLALLAVDFKSSKEAHVVNGGVRSLTNRA